MGRGAYCGGFRRQAVVPFFAFEFELEHEQTPRSRG